MRRSLPGPAGCINPYDDSVRMLPNNSGVDGEVVFSDNTVSRETLNREAQIKKSLYSVARRMIESNEEISLDKLYQHGQLATVADVFEGLHDLKIKRILLIIEDMKVNVDGTISLFLQDWTGRITGNIVPEEIMKLQLLDMHLSSNLSPGSILYLQQVSIYVARSPFQRLLNITCQSITAIFPNHTT